MNAIIKQVAFICLIFASSTIFCLGTNSNLQQYKKNSQLTDNNKAKNSPLEPPSAEAEGNKLLSTSVNVKILGFTCTTFDVKATDALRKAFISVLSLENVGNVEAELEGCKDKNPLKADPAAAAAMAQRRRRLSGFVDVLIVQVTVNVGDATKLLASRQLLVGMTTSPEKITAAFKTALVDVGAIVPDGVSMSITMSGKAATDKLVEAAKKASRSACDYQDCRQCTKDPNCGWCDIKGICQAGDALGPKQGLVGEPCSMWSYDTCGGSACNGFKTCGDCMGDPDCGWCEDSCSCQDKHPGDPTAPEFGECRKGWFHNDGWARKQCPAPASSTCSLKTSILNGSPSTAAWAPTLVPKGNKTDVAAALPPPSAINDASAKPNGGLDVKLYPAAFVIQSSITVVGYKISTFNNAQKIAFRTGMAAEMGTSLAAVEIDGIYPGKVPTDDELDNKDAKLLRRRRRLLQATGGSAVDSSSGPAAADADDGKSKKCEDCDGEAVAITFSLGAQSDQEKKRLLKALDSAMKNTGALLQTLHMSGLVKAGVIYFNNDDSNDDASGPSATNIFGEPDKPKPKAPPKPEPPKLWDSDSSGGTGGAGTGGAGTGGATGAPAPVATPATGKPKAKKKCPFSQKNVNSPCFIGNALVKEKSKCLSSGASPKCMDKAKKYCVLTKFCGCRDPGCIKFGLAKAEKCNVPKCPFSKRNPKSPCYEGDCTLPKKDKFRKAAPCRLLGANRACMAKAKIYCKTKNGCSDEACQKFKLTSQKCKTVWAVNTAFAVTDEDKAAAASGPPPPPAAGLIQVDENIRREHVSWENKFN